MAQATIGALRVNLGLNSAAFRDGLQRANNGMQNFARAIRSGLAVATVAVAGFTVAFGRAMQTAISHADEMYKASQAVGTTVESLSQLTHAAEMSGSSFESLQTGLRRLATAMDDVNNGSTGPASRAFEELGISVVDAQGGLRSIDDVMSDLSGAFSQMEDGAQKSAMANALLGRSGTQLIPMLNAGADGLRGMRDEADRLGLTISTNTGQAAEAFNDNLARLRRTFTGIKNQVAAALLPVFERFSEALLDLMQNQDFVRGMSEGLVEVFKRVAIAALQVSKAIYGIGQATLAASGGITGFADRYYEGQQRVAEMNETIDGLIATIRDDSMISNGGIARRISSAFETAAGSVRQSTEEIGAAIETNVGGATRRAVESIGPPLDLLSNQVMDVGNTMQDSFGSFFQGVSSSIGEAIKGTKSWKDVAIDALTSLANSAIQNFAGMLGGQGGGIFSSLLGGLLGGGGLGGFGGFFAKGGTLGAGQWGIAGEAGPEIVRGPAQIQPMAAMGANSAAPQPIQINQRVTVSGTIGQQEIARAIAEANRSALAQVPGIALNTVTTANRRQPGTI